MIFQHLGKNNKIKVFRGSENNVLDRFYKTAKFYKANWIVRITADCPLIDPDIVDRGIEIFKSENYDYVTNTFPRTFPDGNETEIFSFKALDTAFFNSNLPSEHEHVTPYFYKHPDDFKIHNFSLPQNLNYIQLSVDTKQDMDNFAATISQMKRVHWEYTLDDILEIHSRLLLKNDR